MLSTVSPYALLTASKPRPAPHHTSAYDLYSIAQDQPPSSGFFETAAMADPPELPMAPPGYTQPARKTHYVSEIKTKHSAALSRAAMQSGQISSSV